MDLTKMNEKTILSDEVFEEIFCLLYTSDAADD